MPYLQIDYKKIHYTDLQPTDSPPRSTILFIHGIGCSQNYYHALAISLQAQQHRCILFDNTGAARSPYTQIEQSVESYAADALHILDALKADRAVVVGHSLGSVIAAHLAATHSSRVTSLVLMGPLYLPNPNFAPIFEKRIELVEHHGMDPIANLVPFTSPGKAASGVVRAFIRDLMLAQDPRGYISQTRVLINAKPPAYKEIKMPVLAIAGSEEFTAPKEEMEKLMEALGAERKRLVVLEGVGHWQCFEAEEKVFELMLEFVGPGEE
ncbi:3-oxoadipate enol-lactone hydrolase [Sporormia fimetaria CBS 119925]|uniref:3-oxoadipate enol-lactone hydrolase n=1 Tax=Sporormia fimetaria CBS 119925 TaxID=1340428 RepID=A0A6A6UWR6_9PLEO|nr:3-oxoadipate enol-lactone hydrolase [Sporormia fimetaria CBS 119925]